MEKAAIIRLNFFLGIFLIMPFTGKQGKYALGRRGT